MVVVVAYVTVLSFDCAFTDHDGVCTFHAGRLTLTCQDNAANTVKVYVVVDVDVMVPHVPLTILISLQTNEPASIGLLNVAVNCIVGDDVVSACVLERARVTVNGWFSIVIRSSDELSDAILLTNCFAVILYSPAARGCVGRI